MTGALVRHKLLILNNAQALCGIGIRDFVASCLVGCGATRLDCTRIKLSAPIWFGAVQMGTRLSATMPDDGYWIYGTQLSSPYGQHTSVIGLDLSNTLSGPARKVEDGYNFANSLARPAVRRRRRVLRIPTVWWIWARWRSGLGSSCSSRSLVLRWPAYQRLMPTDGVRTPSSLQAWQP